MADKLRCGIIGTGAIGCDHLHSLALTHRATAVAVAEINPETAKEACERFRITRSYTDYHELLDQPDIEAVTIALPNHLHLPVTLDALKARKHVFLEKPMAANFKDAAKMADAAKKMKRTLMVGQNLRFDRQTQLAKSLIERGDLGQVYHARALFLRRNGIPRIGSWFTQKKFAGGGCTFDIGSHLLDACLYLLNDFNPTSVSAQTHARFGPRGLGEMDWGKSPIDLKKPFDVEDYCSALLRFQNGKSIAMEVSWAGFHSPDSKEIAIHLLGSNAGLTLFPARLFRNGPNGYETIQLEAPKVPYLEDRLHHFVNSVLDGKKPLITPDESLQLQKILDGIYTSAATGKEVRLK